MKNPSTISPSIVDAIMRYRIPGLSTFKEFKKAMSSEPDDVPFLRSYKYLINQYRTKNTNPPKYQLSRNSGISDHLTFLLSFMAPGSRVVCLVNHLSILGERNPMGFQVLSGFLKGLLGGPPMIDFHQNTIPCRPFYFKASGVSPPTSIRPKIKLSVPSPPMFIILSAFFNTLKRFLRLPTIWLSLDLLQQACLLYSFASRTIRPTIFSCSCAVMLKTYLFGYRNCQDTNRL